MLKLLGTFFKIHSKFSNNYKVIQQKIVAQIVQKSHSNLADSGCQTLLQTEGLYCRNFAATDANLLYAQSSDLQIFNSKFSSFC